MTRRKGNVGPRPKPEIIIFDCDGVLVDVRGSFHRSTLDTVHHFTGRRFRHADILHWKSQSGFNDDWKLTTAWVNSLGVRVQYAEVKAQYMKFYWGENGRPGNVALEKWLVPRRSLVQLARRAELNIFTGRTRQELQHTLERFAVQPCFRRIVTMDDVARLKPDPEGLLQILNGRDAGTALYLGDNVDDAIAAQRAGVPFLGVLPRGSGARRVLQAQLRLAGALAILNRATDVLEWL